MPTKKRTWFVIPVRVALWTFIGTLLSFAVSLLLGILGVVIVSTVRGVHPNMAVAYRSVAFPAALVAGAFILLFVLRMEIRQYRQSKMLEAIERVS